MKKTIFKKILCIINYMNTHVEHVSLANTLQQQLAEEKILLSEETITSIIRYISDMGILYRDHVGYDLIPCAAVFARADSGSIAEGLAFMECLMKHGKPLHAIRCILQQEPNIDLRKMMDAQTFDILSQTVILKSRQNTYAFNPVLMDDIKAIVSEYEQGTPIISVTLSAIYANELIHHEDAALRYRNEDSVMVEYDQMKTIVKIIPRRGIPESRDVTKPVQAFYKDTLMHEFHHACPICGIDIPHILIASHIKPFRDCAHIYEALDHNNGLLLCRNHDYLFDQGYISFQDDGGIILSDILKQKENLESSFMLHEKLSIAKEFMSKERKLFFSYHRKHIFIDK